MDNDCEVISENILGQLAEIFTEVQFMGEQMALSPRVIGINNQPHRSRTAQIASREIGFTGIIGGLFHVVPAQMYSRYRYPENLPKAWGQDDDFCHWLYLNNWKTGYVESLIVNHYETTTGQCARFPDYFERKWKEEKES
jgi:hypothetical protein